MIRNVFYRFPLTVTDRSMHVRLIRDSKVPLVGVNGVHPVIDGQSVDHLFRPDIKR